MIFQLFTTILSLAFIVHYLYYVISSLLRRDIVITMQSEDAKFIKK